MRYFRTAAFLRSYRSLDSSRRKRVDRALLQLEILFDQRQKPFGLGLKSLKPSVWEVRAGRDDRIAFHWTEDRVEFLIVGNHDEIRRLLKQL